MRTNKSMACGCQRLAVATFSLQILSPKRGIVLAKMNLSVHIPLLTLSQTTNFRPIQTQEFTDDNFKFDENGRKFSKLVENTVGTGEIARYEQFLLFPHCFQKVSTADTLKPGLVWEMVNIYFEFQVYMFNNGRDMTKCDLFSTSMMTTLPRL